MGEKNYLVVRWVGGRPEIVSRPIPHSERHEAFAIARDMRVQTPDQYVNVVVETVDDTDDKQDPDQETLPGLRG